MLTNPESRRGFRSLVVNVAIISLLVWIMHDAQRLSSASVAKLLAGALAIIGVYVFGNIIENGIRSLEATIWGASVKMTGDAESGA